MEFAVVVPPNQLQYVSNFSSPEPTKRFGTGRSDRRLYFLWQGGGRKASDIALLKRAGVEVGDNVVLQFYPADVEEKLRQLEVRYRGRQPAEIRVTRFQVVPTGTATISRSLPRKPSGKIAALQYLSFQCSVNKLFAH